MNKINILIVDDSRADMFLTKDTITELNIDCNVLTARNGIEAIDIINSTKVDLILMDIKMPKLDGLETLRKIRNEHNDKNISVIMLTTSNYDNDIIESKNLNADAYIVKPPTTNEFLDKIKTLNNIYIKKQFEFIKYK
jgi:CheY-like chemotaxis protein